MKLQTGKPVMEGLYIVFVPAIVKDWLEPHIVTWTKGGWFHRWSTEKYPDDVKGWFGPLPIVKNEIDPGKYHTCPQCRAVILTAKETADEHMVGCPEAPAPSGEYDL